MLWEVSLPCAWSTKYGNEHYTMLIYYVNAESKSDAEAKAESWLPDGYSLDDSPLATPYDPAKDCRPDLTAFSHSAQQVIKIVEIARDINNHENLSG